MLSGGRWRATSAAGTTRVRRSGACRDPTLRKVSTPDVYPWLSIQFEKPGSCPVSTKRILPSESTAVRLGGLLRDATSPHPVEQYQAVSGKVGTPTALLDDLVAALTRAIEELTRPIDTIKHQAKTVTVGISRSDEGIIEDAKYYDYAEPADGTCADGGTLDRTLVATGLPFFENFYAGGTRSVRGFRDNTLGPRSEVISGFRGQPLGGSLKTTGSVELIFPKLFDSNAARVSAFFDFGNVFDGVDNFDAGELRASAGVALLWRAPVGPISISYAYPFLSLAYVVVAVYAYFVFQEDLSPARIAGIGFIVLGTIFIAQS